MNVLTPPVSISKQNEKNPWLAAAARFDEPPPRPEPGRRHAQGAAHVDQGDYRAHSGAARRRPHRGLHRLPRAALAGARPGQGRHPLRARRDARRSARAGLLDDVEMRGGEHPVRRRQGRRDLRPQPAVRRRTGEADAPLHRRDHRLHRAGARRAGARRQHQRKGDGVDHGHLFHARAPHRHGGGHRQADGAGRLARPPGSHRPRLHDRHPEGAGAPRPATRRRPRGDSGLRQRGRHGGAPDGRQGLQNRRHRGVRWRGLQSQGPGHRRAAAAPQGDRLHHRIRRRRGHGQERGHVSAVRRAAARRHRERHHFRQRRPPALQDSVRRRQRPHHAAGRRRSWRTRRSS